MAVTIGKAWGADRGSGDDLGSGPTPLKGNVCAGL